MISKSTFLFFTALLTVISWQPVSVTAQDLMLPKKLAIYYGFPSYVNGSTSNNDTAVNVFKDYDVVVFGDSLQFPQYKNKPGQVFEFGCNQNSHQDHDNTVKIIKRLKTPQNQTAVYGYVSIGGENTARRCSPAPEAPPVPLSQAEIEERIDAWAAMGVAGIFLDEAEYGFGTSRERQNAAIDYVHSKGLSVFINGYNPAEVFDAQVIDKVLYTTGSYAGTYSSIAMNPQGQPTHLEADDIYLLEHFQVISGNYQNPDLWASRSDETAAYQEQYDVQVATVTTPAPDTTAADCSTLFNRQQFDYAWWSTLLYGFDYMSWSEPLGFSSWGPCINQLPFYDRPHVGDIGNAFTGPVAQPFPGDPPLYTRTTTAGIIEIDVVAHTGRFTPFDPPPPPNNNPPVAGDDTVTTHQDTPVTIDLLANDTDPDGDALNITSMTTTSTQGGAIVSNGDHTHTYTPPAGFSGTDSFTYTISDGKGGSATANVSITVLPGAPPVAADQAVATIAETPVVITLTGSDADNDPLTFSVVTQPTQGTLSGTAPNLTYTPNPGFSGTDSFTFKVNDGTADSNTATVNITVTTAPVNTPPVVADQAVATIAETPVAITLTGSDADNDPLTFSVVTQPTQGTLSGTAPNLTYTPNSGFSGTDSFTFKVNDGTADSNVATVNITVTAIVSGDTIGLYDPLTSAFYLKRSNTSGKADIVYRYGPAGGGWLPVMGDWNHDGVHTAGLYDPFTGTFYLKNIHSGGKADVSFRYGPAHAGWQPLIGDWNGDGTDTVGLYDPASGTFYLKDNHSGGQATYRFRFGFIDPDLIPLAGDWDGDGQDTVGLYHPRTGIFYLVNAHRGGQADLSFRYGPVNAVWQPLAGDWNGNGTDTIGLYRPDTSQFYLRQTNTSGVADLNFRYGPAGQSWQPLGGAW